MKRKSRLQILMLFLFLMTTTFAAHASGLDDHPSLHANTATSISRVTPGSSILAKFRSENFAEAQLSIENSAGKVLMHKAIVLDPGDNLLQLQVSEIPAGAYFIKVKSAQGTHTMTIVVQ